MATFVGATLSASGEITALRPDSREVEIDAYIKNQFGEVVTPGQILVRFADEG